MKLAIIGGSGSVIDHQYTDKIEVPTPWGIVDVHKDGETFFIYRHGFGHFLAPHEVNYRANIWACRVLGVQQVLSICAVGSLRNSIQPGHVVVPIQIVDRTFGRPSSFLQDGLVGHVDVAEPFCEAFSIHLWRAVRATGAKVWNGTYLCVNGPRFSTKAESELYRSWGMDIIGMTAAPESFLAREAGLCYGAFAMVTDYDVWKGQPVSTEMIADTMEQNRETIMKAVANLRDKSPDYACECGEINKSVIMTDARTWPEVHPAFELFS